MPNIGPMEIAIVLVVLLVIFGPKQLPKLARSIGGGIHELRASVTGESNAKSEKEIAEPTAQEPNEQKVS